MIYTVTLNPSLDYIVDVDDFTLGMTNRTKNELMMPGGKGINVSIMLKNLGYTSVSMGFIAGFTGDEIEKLLDNEGINVDFIKLEKGNSRINVKLSSIDGTEINGMGPEISEEDFDKLLYKLEILETGDVLILSGSIPTTMSSDTYQAILDKLDNKEVMYVVDASGDLLLKSLKYKPFLIKPNLYELSEIFGVELSEYEDVIPYAVKLKEQGAENVLVTMGAKGSILVTGDSEVYIARLDNSHQVINSVGAGDSAIAGFIAGYYEKNDYIYALETGMATACASACSQEFATNQFVEEMRACVKIERFK